MWAKLSQVSSYENKDLAALHFGQMFNLFFCYCFILGFKVGVVIVSLVIFAGLIYPCMKYL